jgi:hypothetical protein
MYEEMRFNYWQGQETFLLLWGLFLQGYSGWGVKLTAYVYLVLRLRKGGAILSFLYIFIVVCLIKHKGNFSAVVSAQSRLY